MKAIVLAGGKGARLAPYTRILPKPLLPIGDMPILEVLLCQMRNSGIEEVVLTVGHMAHLLESYFKDGSRYGVRLSYSREEKPLGTAGPLSLVEGLDSTFIVTNGDVLTDLKLCDLVEYHKTQKAAATIAMHGRRVKINLGVIELDGANRVVGYDEKPCLDYCVSMGIYVFEPGVLQYIPWNQYLDFPDLVLKLIEGGERVVGYPFNGYWQDLGTPSEYEEANDEFESKRADIMGEAG